MNKTQRTLVILGSLVVLAAKSQAQSLVFQTNDPGIVFDNINEADITPPNLSQIPVGQGTVSDSGSFTVSGAPIVSFQVTDVTGSVNDGTLSLQVWIDGTNTYLYNQTVSSGTALSEYANTSGLNLDSGLHKIDYSATYVGFSNADSAGYLGSFAVDVNPAATPEPGSVAVMGVGMVGLMLRRQRRQK